MEVVLVVGLGGAIGAILRWWVGLSMNHLLAPTFLGTLVVNLVGSFMVGLLLIWFQERIMYFHETENLNQKTQKLFQENHACFRKNSSVSVLFFLKTAVREIPMGRSRRR